MKTRLAVVTVFVFGIGGASAFTLDFAALASGTTVPGEPGALVLNVPGYGNVAFSSGAGSDLEITTMIGSGGPTQAINMNNGEALVVTFQALPVSAVNFGFEQVGPGEWFTSSVLGPNKYQVNFSGANAGVSAVNFVPEPATALLGALGSLLLLRRRREA